MGLLLGVRDCIDNMWEEEEEQIRECGGSDSVWERLRNHPIYSPPQSPTSVFLIAAQFHFSPQPTPSVLMSPYLDFSPPPPPPPPLRILCHYECIFISAPRKFSSRGNSRCLISANISEVAIYGIHYIELDLRFRSNPNTQHARSSTRLIASICIGETGQCHSSKPLRTNLEDLAPDIGRALQEVLFLIDECPCLSVVKTSRKLSIELLQVLPSVQLPQTLQIAVVEEKMTQLLSYSGEFISQDSSLVEERSVEITVEVDATNNGAHGVKAYESFPIVSRLEKKNTRDKLKRNYKSISVLTRKDLEQHFGSSRENVANSFGVSERKKERFTEVVSPSMHEKHDSRLQCIQKPLHARSSPRTIALLDGGEMVSVSTVKRISRKHGIPRWPSQKKRKVSKTDCILLEPQGEKDVSPTCSKMPTDGQTERGNEMVSHLQDQNEGPNLLNTENGSNKESITTLIFEDSVPVSEMDYILFEPEVEKSVSPTCKTPIGGIVLDFIEGPNLSNTENHANEESLTTPTFPDSVPVFERDCIFLEPQGEKNMSPTHKTPTNGQTEVANGMVGHIQDQNGIVPEFIEGPNLLNKENRSNEKSLTTPNFQDSVPGNYLAMDFSISSTYRESGEAGGSSELAFQQKELTPSTTYPNPGACVFTQPHISLREMLIENVGSSKDSRNFPTSAVGFLMGDLVSESSWTMPLCSDQAPMQTMTTIPHTMPHLTEKQDMRTVTFKAQYRDKKIKFRLSLSSGIVELKKEVTKRLGELGIFEVHYQDNDNEWILIGCDTDVLDCFELSSSSGNEVVRLLVRD
ncbi:unnamed protein product [Camellia sinensis]